MVLSISAVFVRIRRRGFKLEEGLAGASLLCTRDSLSVCGVSADMVDGCWLLPEGEEV